MYREKSRGERTQPWGEPVLIDWKSETCSHSFTCCFLSDRKSVILLMKQSQDDGVKGRAEIHTQDPGVGSCGVQVLEDVMEGQVDCIVYRPVGSVGELQGVQEGVGDVFQV